MHEILDLIKSNKTKSPTEKLDKHIEKNPIPPKSEFIPNYIRDSKAAEMTVEDLKELDDRTPQEKKHEENSEEDIYSIKNFSI